MSRRARFHRDEALERRLVWMMVAGVVAIAAVMALLVYFLGTPSPR